MKRITIVLSVLGALSFVGCGSSSGGTDGGTPAAPTLGTQIDGNGRPAINTALVATFNGDSVSKGASKDAYNAAGPAEWPDFKEQFKASLGILDSLDTICGNQLLADDEDPNGRYDALAGVLVDDRLYVNSDSGTCGVYLGVEAEAIEAVGAGEGGCGGRSLDDDVIERSYSILATGALGGEMGVDDTITANDVANSTTFPFLAAPQ